MRWVNLNSLVRERGGWVWVCWWKRGEHKFKFKFVGEGGEGQIWICWRKRGGGWTWIPWREGERTNSNLLKRGKDRGGQIWIYWKEGGRMNFHSLFEREEDKFKFIGERGEGDEFKFVGGRKGRENLNFLEGGWIWMEMQDKIHGVSS
jgi:hypothetical protein